MTNENQRVIIEGENNQNLDEAINTYMDLHKKAIEAIEANPDGIMPYTIDHNLVIAGNKIGDLLIRERKKAKEYFQKAIAQDPNFINAYK